LKKGIFQRDVSVNLSRHPFQGHYDEHGEKATRTVCGDWQDAKDTSRDQIEARQLILSINKEEGIRKTSQPCFARSN
jgi:hypothetical protein